MAAVTSANMRMSLVSGTAFVDFSASGALTPYLGAKVTITDSASKAIVGYIKAAGTGETLGDNLLVNGGFDTDVSGWGVTDATIASVPSDLSGNALEITRTGGATQHVERACPLVPGGLHDIGAYAKSGTSGDTRATLIVVEATFGLLWYAITTSGTWQIIPARSMTANVDALQFYLYKDNAIDGTMIFDTAYVRQVLTPSATGVTIVSTPGGGTSAWTSEAAGFNRNDAAGYTYTILRIGGMGTGSPIYRRRRR